MRSRLVTFVGWVRSHGFGVLHRLLSLNSCFMLRVRRWAVEPRPAKGHIQRVEDLLLLVSAEFADVDSVLLRERFFDPLNPSSNCPPL